MASLYTIKESNMLKSFVIMAIFFALVGGVGFALSIYLDSFILFVVASIIALGTNIYSYWGAHKTVLKITGAKEVKRNKETEELYDVVENIAITANIPMPKVCIVNDPAPNAFATGRNPKNGVVAVTTGLLQVLDRDELEGVIAHEIAHIKNRDTLVMTTAFALAGIVSIIANYILFFGGGNDRENNPIVSILLIVGILLTPLVATILKLTVSRKREYIADATAALITRYPEGLASALEKIRAHSTQPLKKQNHTVAHFFINDPYIGNANAQKKASFFNTLFSTHPPIDDRIQKLRASI